MEGTPFHIEGVGTTLEPATNGDRIPSGSQGPSHDQNSPAKVVIGGARSPSLLVETILIR